MQYKPLNDVFEASIESRTEVALRAFLNARAAGAMRSTLDEMQRSGLVDEDTAARLALEMVDQLSADKTYAGRPAPPVIGQTDIQALTAPEPEPEPPKKRRPKRPKRTCPICGKELFSPTAIGCVKHWRQVKRQQAERDKALLDDYYDEEEAE